MPRRAARRLNLSSSDSGTSDEASMEKVDFAGDRSDCLAAIAEALDLLAGLELLDADILPSFGKVETPINTRAGVK